MRIQDLSADAALDAVNSSWDGLAPAEAAHRLAEFGANQVEKVRTTPLWVRLLAQFTHLFAILLWLAAALALFAAWRQPGAGMGTLAAAILLVILINGLFSFWQEYRSERALDSLRRLLPHRVKVRRAGDLLEVAADALVPGDLLVLEEGDAVPADCRVVRTLGVRLNLSAVTGESMPISRDAHPEGNPHNDITTARNVLLAGTTVVAGEAWAVVFATGMRTVLGGIAHVTQTADPGLSPLQREVARLSRIIAVLALGLGAAFFAIGTLMGIPLWQAGIFAIGLMVANVPEGLLPTLTLALAMAGQRLARKNVLLRKLAAVETLGAATVICTDKTGTLTENRMIAHAVHVGGRLLAPAAVADDNAGRLLLETAACCHSLEVVDGHLSGDPTEIALVELAGGRPGAAAEDALPFDADRRRMSVRVGNVLHMKGALDVVLPLCLGLSDGDIKGITAAEAAMARQGLRVLALARRQLPPDTARERWESGLHFLGLVGLEDPPRPEVPDAVAQCRAAGIRVIMVTGDHPRTAEAIARRVGLVCGERPRVVVGDQLARWSKTQLQLALDAPEIIFARTRADQKWRIVEALQNKGHVVAVTGDGVNDAPALKQADIGIAMGHNGTDVAREAADMVLVDDNFASIVAAVQEGRAVFDNIRKFLTYILTSNIPEIVPYVAFAGFGAPLALTVPQILAVDLGTDMVPALALAVEPPQADVMTRPPRARHQRLVDWRLLARAYGFLGPLQGLAAMAAFFTVLERAGAGGTARATTATLAAIVLCQMANLFVCRSRVRSTFSVALAGNPMIFAGLAIEALLLLALVYTPAGNALFQTAPLQLADWLVALPFAGLLLAAEEGRKALVRLAGKMPVDAGQRRR